MIIIFSHIFKSLTTIYLHLRYEYQFKKKTKKNNKVVVAVQDSFHSMENRIFQIEIRISGNFQGQIEQRFLLDVPEGL